MVLRVIFEKVSGTINSPDVAPPYSPRRASAMHCTGEEVARAASIQTTDGVRLEMKCYYTRTIADHLIASRPSNIKVPSQRLVAAIPNTPRAVRGPSHRYRVYGA